MKDLSHKGKPLIFTPELTSYTMFVQLVKV
jgi:hypothetical protein